MAWSPDGSTPAVAVVGSANLDLVVEVERHPQPGETVLGGEHLWAPGGKGANQAVAAARLGARVGFVGLVGDDEPGRTLRAALVSAGVDVAALETSGDIPTGIAMIAVDPSGENTIVVSPGANGALGRAQVEAAADLLAGCEALLVQLEVPMEAVVAAARLAGGTVIVNPAPATTLPHDLLAATDVLVPNRSELARLAGEPVPSRVTEVERLVGTLPDRLRVIVTLGSDGALVHAEGRSEHVAAHEVEAVDATAAGDAFCGALAGALVDGATLIEAARWANAAAAVTVTRRGAQPSLPTADEVAAVSGRPPA